MKKRGYAGPPKIHKDDLPKIARMLEDDHSVPEIAKHFGVSRQTILKYVYRFGYKRHPLKGWILTGAKNGPASHKSLSETELKTAVKHGFITQKAYAKELAGMGYSPSNVDLKIKILRKEIQEKVVASKKEDYEDLSGLPLFEDDALLLTNK